MKTTKISRAEIRVVIVDDEPLALLILRKFLKKYAFVNVIAEASSGQEALAKIHGHSPDLVFMDIQMPGMNGFEVIEAIQADIMPLIVFVTAYDQYAVDAFRIHAVDYILKPLDEAQLHEALMRCMTLRTTHSRGKSKILGAVRSIQKRGDPQSTSVKPADQFVDKKIVVRDRQEITLIDQQEIDWIDAAGDYMCLHVAGVTHILRSTMTKLLAQLNPDKFKRIHRSTVVNISRIRRIVPLPKGEYYLKLDQDQQLKVSRSYGSVVKAFLNRVE